MTNHLNDSPTTRHDSSMALVYQIEEALAKHFARGTEPWEAFDFLLASLRDGVTTGEWGDQAPTVLLNCLEDILEAHLVYGGASHG